MATPEIAADPEAKRPLVERRDEPVIVVPVMACAERAPEIVEEAPFKMAPPDT